MTPARSRRYLCPLHATLAAAIATLALCPAAQAGDVVYNNDSGAAVAAGNWSALTWTQTTTSGTVAATTYPGANDAGNVAQHTGAGGSTSTTTLNVPVTIGGLYVGSQAGTVANWTINSDGTNVFTLNGAGLTNASLAPPGSSGGDQAFGQTSGEAAIASRSGGTLTVNPGIVMASNLGIGTTSPQSGSVVINGGITASAAATLYFRGSSNTGVAGTVTLNGGVGASGSNIAISNLRASGATAAGAITLNGNLGPSVTTVTQGALTTMVLAGTNTYSGATTISAGTLQIQGGSAIPDTSAVNMSGGTLAVVGGSKEGTGAVVTGGSASGTNAVGLGALTLTANSTLNFDTSNGNNLVFASGFAPGTFKLAVTNWTNTNYNGTTASGQNGDDRLIFAQDMSGYLAAFNFNNAGAGVGVSELALGGGFYEVGFVAVPEPATWAVGLLLGASVAARFRRSRPVPLMI